MGIVINGKIHMQSPNGTQWLVSADDDGTLDTVSTTGLIDTIISFPLISPLNITFTITITNDGQLLTSG